MPMFKAPQFEREMVGDEMLRRLAQDLFGDDTDPTRFFFEGQAQQVSKRGENYILSLKLPFTSQEDIKLMQTGDDLIIEVGWHRRNIVLPTSLARFNAIDAVFVGDELEVTFEPPKPVSAAPPTFTESGKSKALQEKK